VERLDGNAIGGVLAEIFGTEMTTASRVCLGCGAHGVVAEVHVYIRAPGVVVRCPECESVLMRIVRSADRTWLDLSGLASLELRH
jgi:hypothetical protein